MSMTMKENGDIYVNGSKIEIVGKSVILLSEDQVMINGTKYNTPKFFGKRKIINCDEVVFVNGHEFINGKFKLTVRSILITLFL